jgi:hypothetical protein
MTRGVRWMPRPGSHAYDIGERAEGPEGER